MPSKLKKAIAAVKDQTSISLAKVGAGGESASLEVAILKATTHDETPVDERHVTDVLQRVSSNRCYAGPCARAIGRRVGRTRSWVVAIKSLMLVLRIFQDGDPHFPKEVYNAMKRGYKILNLSSFRDDSSTSCPWDFTAFVRTFALYLDERLECFLTGKLQRRVSVNGHGSGSGYGGRRNEPIVRDMKPSKLLDRISHWQKLLDRAIATRPTGAARTNWLAQTCLYAIVQETFDLYRDISDGLALLLDSFFHLQYANCTMAYQTCVKASKQFQELCSFYELCKNIGVGRISEYPSVNNISEELLDTLQEFLKDQSSFPSGPNNDPTPGSQLALKGPSGSPEGGSVRDRAGSEFGGSRCPSSLEDLMSADPGFSPERYSDPGGEKPSSQMEEYLNGNDTASVRSDPTDNRGVNTAFDLLSLDDESPPQEPSNNEPSSSPSSKQGWELALFEAARQNAQTTAIASASSSSPWTPPENSYNPFLQDRGQLNGPGSGSGLDLFEGLGTQASSSNASGGFPPDLGLQMGGFQPIINPDFSDTYPNPNANVNIAFSAGFPTSLGTENSTITQPDLSDLFGGITNSNINTRTPDHLGFESGNMSPSPAFRGGYSNEIVQPSFVANSGDLSSNSMNAIVPFGYSGDGSANAMNSLVPFGQNPGNEEFFSSAPTFTATPTFQASDSESFSGFHTESDPFADQKMGVTLDQESLLQQQQLWLQNQSEIMSKLST